ncbi:DUF4376 domain-containing protein [Fusobacterium polymorphum]|jgi:hypothetical protein fuD12_11244|uniref:DUF4376 domain-containing protein n=1 Tax=Fusobacterium nucleatum subsp. polymorphum TaxID=76857 RepID=UPI00206B56BF|nr:MAG TPA: protein of unknown function (DUF4376) [Caudoviricetes sp.]DAY32397.1 MAG TPA: protein of unknown function (DUF4376) [Caudoviricetes sp.]
MIYIYKKDELIDTLNYDINEFKKEWYPNFQKDMKVYDRKFEYPIFENEELREMTKEEKIKNGIDVILEEGEVIENKNLIKIPKPSIYHKWIDKEWVLNLKELKLQKREELKQIRTSKLFENITVNGDTFQVRNEDLENFWEVDYMLKNGEVLGDDERSWVLSDNTIKTFKYSQLMNVLTEFIKRKATIFNKFTELSIKLEISKNIEEIGAIKWQ